MRDPLCHLEQMTYLLQAQIAHLLNRLKKCACLDSLGHCDPQSEAQSIVVIITITIINEETPLCGWHLDSHFFPWKNIRHLLFWRYLKNENDISGEVSSPSVKKRFGHRFAVFSEKIMQHPDQKNVFYKNIKYFILPPNLSNLGLFLCQLMRNQAISGYGSDTALWHAQHLAIHPHTFLPE